MVTPCQNLVGQYRELLAEVYPGGTASPTVLPLPPELQVQSWWAAGQLVHEAPTQRNGMVRILDSGRWNRSSGPDFTHAEIELNGIRKRGDIEIDPHAQDWEQHGHGANPAFNNVILHVVLTPPPAGWYTRNSLHQDIPILYIPQENWLHHSSSPCEKDDALPRCRQPLSDAAADKVIHLLQAAAAYRFELKRSNFRQRVAAVGEAQAWYEAWGTTLGYSANKSPMHMLTLRAPLKRLGSNAEAILLGTAGFLVPVLPPKAGEDARNYHRRVWDSWWMVREDFELSGARELPWCKAPARPLNHPQRRVAALAATVPHWKRIMPLLHAAAAEDLAKRLSAISHPFWDTHYTLTSAPIKHPTALIGEPRIADFLINHVFPNDASEHAWQRFLELRQGALPGSISRTAWLLFGERPELKSTLRHAYAQQALLQIDADFCARNICQDCAFPAQLCQWVR